MACPCAVLSARSAWGRPLLTLADARPMFAAAGEAAPPGACGLPLAGA